MVSKNNRIKRMEEAAGRQSHFGIRKLTVGAASVLLGITLLFGANAKVARADETNVNTGANVPASVGKQSVNSSSGSKAKVNETNTTSTKTTTEQTIKKAADEITKPGAKGDTQKTTSTSKVAVKTTKSSKQNNESINTSDLDTGDTTPYLETLGASLQETANNKQGEVKPPVWYMDDPSKATNEETAHKNLESAIGYVREEIEKNGSIKGLTVSGQDLKVYDNENLSAKDMQKQANDIWQKISTYVEKRKEFIRGLKEQGIYKDGDVDPTTLAQHLILQSEPDAKSEYKILAKGNDVVTVNMDYNVPFVNPAYAVQLKNNSVDGPIIQITYTNLKNSKYDGKPLGKIVETFSDVHATDINGPKAAFYISTNPTNGWLYSHCDGVTATIQLYDNQANPQPIKIDSSAYVSVSSLNSNGLTATPDGETSDIKGRTEAAQLISKGSAMSIPESSVQVFPHNKVFSPSDNENLLDNKIDNQAKIDYWGKFFASREAGWNKMSLDQQNAEIQRVGTDVINNYSYWDYTESKKIFGSALYKVEENPIVIRSYVIRNSGNSIPGYWFTYSTTVPQTSFDAINAISYHFATAHSVTNAPKTVVGSQTVEYIDGKTKQRISEKDYPDKIQKVTFTGANGTVTDKSGNKYNVKKDKVTGKIVKVNSQTGEITDLTDIDNVIYDWTWNTNDKRGNASQVTADNVDVPKIKGYIASTDTEIGSTEKNTTQPGKIVPIKDKNGKETGKYVVPGNSISVDNPTTVVKVIYNQLGHIIPVDPSGNPIPNVDHPQYRTDPNDPSKVVPNEKTPTIQGYTITPDQPDPGVHYDPKNPTVTPVDPSKPTNVVYAKDQLAEIIYQDLNNPDHPVEITNSTKLNGNKSLTGKAGDTINYSPKTEIAILQNEGYVLDQTNYSQYPAYKEGQKFDDINGNTQTYYINFKHGIVPVDPDHPVDPNTPINPGDKHSPKYPKGLTKDGLTQTIKRTIDYQDKNGKSFGSPVDQTTTFTGNAVIDKVTGKYVLGDGQETDDPTQGITWTGDGKLNGQKSPVFSGYHVIKVSRDSKDNVNVDSTTVNKDTKSYKVIVTYAKNGYIIPVDSSGNPIPNVDHPQYRTDPNDPSKVTPNEPVPDIPDRIPEVPTVTPEDPSKDTPVVYNPIPNVPGPSDNTPTPVTPTPGKTTEEKKPEETKPDETKPDENKDDKDVDEPDDDDSGDVAAPRRSSRKSGISRHVASAASSGYSSNVAPHGQYAGAASSLAPKAQSTLPNGESINAKGQVLNAAGQVIGYIDKNGQVHYYSLPQNGEDQNDLAAILGAGAVAISMIGLAGVKKRRNN